MLLLIELKGAGGPQQTIIGRPLLAGARHIVNDQVNLTIQYVKKGYKLID